MMTEHLEELEMTVPSADPNHGNRPNKLESKIDMIYDAVVGTATTQGMGERLRKLESFVLAVKLVVTACIIAVCTVTATSNIHIGPITTAPVRTGK